MLNSACRNLRPHIRRLRALSLRHVSHPPSSCHPERSEGSQAQEKRNNSQHNPFKINNFHTLQKCRLLTLGKSIRSTLFTKQPGGIPPRPKIFQRRAEAK